MNGLINDQVLNMIQVTKNFQLQAKYAALKDDNKISREEKKQLNKINKAANAYIKELQKILEEKTK
mgnify:CR=1 FL=1